MSETVYFDISKTIRETKNSLLKIIRVISLE